MSEKYKKKLNAIKSGMHPKQFNPKYNKPKRYHYYLSHLGDRRQKPPRGRHVPYPK